METEQLIFLSHSAKDADLAKEISVQIETNLPGFKVFASTRPSAIPSGTEWFDAILEKLESAAALVVLLTPASESSLWVGFEFGYFWKKSGRNSAYFLYHPKASIAGPIANIQGTLITDPEHLAEFFSRLCEGFGREYEAKTDPGLIAGMARMLTVPPPERTYRKFIEFLGTAQWSQWNLENEEVWTCEEDAIYQIVVPRRDFSERDKFDEEWTRGFPNPSTSRQPVQLRIAGTTIMELIFVYLDGARYFVPMPRIKVEGEEKRSFYWVRDSVEYKVHQIVGYLHLDPSLEAFALRKGIEVVDTDIYHED